MKLGICTNMIAAENDRLGLACLDAAAEAGFDYVELPVAGIMELDNDSYLELARMLSESPIKCRCACSLFPPFIKVVGGDADFCRMKEYIKKAADRLYGLGAELIVFGSPLSRSMDCPPYFFKDALYQLQEAVHLIMDCLDIYGMRLAIEPLNRSETNVINTFEQGAGFCRMVNRRGFKSMVDFAHFKINGEPHSSIKANGDMLAHVHISRPCRRKYPIDEGEDDYAGFMKLLCEIGYSGMMSIEAIPENLAIDVKRAHKLLESLLKKYGDFET